MYLMNEDKRQKIGSKNDPCLTNGPLLHLPKYNIYLFFILQKRPKGDKNYVQTCHKNPKKTRWLYDDDRAWLNLLFYLALLQSDLSKKGVQKHTKIQIKFKLGPAICLGWNVEAEISKTSTPLKVHAYLNSLC